MKSEFGEAHTEVTKYEHDGRRVRVHIQTYTEIAVAVVLIN